MLENLSKGWLAKLPVAGVALPLFQLLIIWARNLSDLSLWSALPTILVSVAISTGTLFVVRLFSRSWEQANLAHLALVVYFLFAALVSGLFDNIFIQSTILFLLLLLTFDVVRKIPESDNQSKRITVLVNILLLPSIIALLCIPLVYLSTKLNTYDSLEKYSQYFEGNVNESSPDVWHLVFDRYGDKNTLQSGYNFNNSDFLSELEARGFNVVPAATSNYQRTRHSLASTLNSIYLDPFAKEMDKLNADQTPLNHGITNNSAIRFFNSNGYDTYFSGSWWDASRTSSIATKNINTRDLPELARVFLSRTVAGAVGKIAGVPFGDSRLDQCVRVKYKFNKLKDLTENSNHKYVFAHFLVPHPPYVLTKSGECKTLIEAEAQSRRDNYIAQLEYTNSQILDLIDAILAGPNKATIVLSADEGPWPMPYVGDERYIGQDPVDLDWEILSPVQLREKMGILLASRMFDGSPINHPQTPVNIYPAILNNGFAGNLKLLNHRNSIFLSDDRLYKFKDVTETVSDVDY